MVKLIKGEYKMVKEMVKATTDIVMVINLEDNGKMMKNKLANIYFARVISSKENLKMGKWHLEL
jgi:hypothetical protein